jgi:polyisoprenoid-binding protein YceI
MNATLQQVPTGTYTLDPVHSTFGFAITHNGVSKFRGQFEQADARLEDGVLTGSTQVESVKTPIPQLKEHLLAQDFFNVAETPELSFRSTEISLGSDGEVQIDGELTIRGVTKPLSATGSFASGVGLSGAEVVGFDLEAAIDRRDYGLNWQAPLPSGGDALGWGVSLQVHLELVKS